MIRRLLLIISLFSLFAISQSTIVQADTSQASRSVVVQTVPSESLGSQFVARAKSSWPWYVARASGLVASACLIVLLLSGIGQITGASFRLLDPITAWASHRSLGIAFGIAVLVHMTSLLFDHFVPFTVWQILVPWLSSYRPATVFGLHLGSLYVALGIITFYLITIIIVTSLLWVERKPHTWKIIHVTAYGAVALAFVHALYTGTDVSHGLVRWVFIGLNATVLFAAIARLRRVGSV